MELYVGGRAQGKLSYVQQAHPGEQMEVIEGSRMVNRMETEGCPEKNVCVVWNQFHRYVREHMGQPPAQREAFVDQVVRELPKLCIISDEVGNGIVPVEAEERSYRDEVGRLLCRLAQQAERMERVICGMGQRIK
ncbi:MAG: bifunctional adenosylcobinamide kinase/adenosylcobinamide-phosphate guanylyltransferase [Lachnospiraceae bacterium]|nr:bifunctional adenosylcobinamide kinase/adenosylcobinamide-phosphate guanylyltransferase [Lachnospiraceae bacterium]